MDEVSVIAHTQTSDTTVGERAAEGLPWTAAEYVPCEEGGRMEPVKEKWPPLLGVCGELLTFLGETAAFGTGEGEAVAEGSGVDAMPRFLMTELSNIALTSLTFPVAAATMSELTWWR